MASVSDGDESTLSPEEAFTLLGNETRMEILRTLWEAYEPDAEVNALAFTELRDRVGIRRGGKFNYHLDKLVGHYVRKTDDGYGLRHAGRILVQTVISGTSIEDPVVEPTEVEEGADALASATGSYATCLHCGAPTAVTYQDGTLFLVCTDCEGHRERRELDLSGVLVSGSLDPAGLTNRTLEGATNAHLIRMRDTMLSAIEGVCHRCNSPMDTSLRVCEDHLPEGGCPNCDQMAAITAQSRCRVCKAAPYAPPYWRAVMHPAVIGFFYERGTSLLYTRDAVHPPEDAEQELVSDDPPRVRVAYECDGDRLELLVDEELNVLEMTESD
jgi:hypothetical protein